MTTIELSLIPDADTDYQTVERLMKNFKREAGIDVQLKRMEWGHCTINIWLSRVNVVSEDEAGQEKHETTHNQFR